MPDEWDKDAREIRQGDVYWIDMGRAIGSAPSGLRPCVIVQGNLFNRSRIHTTVICSVTTSEARAEAPGNVVLQKGEGGLERKSVVNISQVMTVDKADLLERIGRLNANRVDEIRRGIIQLIERS